MGKTRTAARLLASMTLFLMGWFNSASFAPEVAEAQEQPSLTYFALGDSYASGHGLADDNRDSDPCLRSPSSYPYLVKNALEQQYGTIKFHHLACSGATAARNPDLSSPFKSLRDQFDVANAYLNHRDGIPNAEPVLVTITIGANDLGLKDWDTRGRVSRQWPPISSATGFYEWLEDKSRPISSSLTPVIDTLMAHENVFIILTDYPNPFQPDTASSRIGNFWCNDAFLTMTCDEALAQTINKLNSIMLDQFLQVNQPERLRAVSLGGAFAGHYSDCFASVPETWFGDDCVHPNNAGAQGIADAVLGMALELLSATVPARGNGDSAGADAPAPREQVAQPAGTLPTFHLPWEVGSVWQISVGNGEGEHSNAANYHGFDAVPAPGRGTDSVVAVADGTILGVQSNMPDSATVNSGHAGNCVIIDHGGGVYSLYAHLAQGSVPVSTGQYVTSGTVIGSMGNSGYSTGPHLHWAVLNDAWMYTDASVSPYETCSGRTIESHYVDPDRELQEDGGIPRTGRYYESFNTAGVGSTHPDSPASSTTSSGAEPVEPDAQPIGPGDPGAAAQEPAPSSDAPHAADATIISNYTGEVVSGFSANCEYSWSFSRQAWIEHSCGFQPGDLTGEQLSEPPTDGCAYYFNGQTFQLSPAYVCGQD